MLKSIVVAVALLLATVAIAETEVVQTRYTGVITQRFVKRSLASGETGSWVEVLRGGTVAIGPVTSGTCRIEYTVSLPSEVTANAAVAIAWPKGDVTAWASSTIDGPLQSVRGVSVTGACVLMVLQ